MIKYIIFYVFLIYKQEIKENKGKVYCAKFNEKNNLVASCGDDSNIILYDVVG